MDIRDCESIQKWFIKPNGERRYKSATEIEYLGYLRDWCRILHYTPDELGGLDVGQQKMVQGLIIEAMEKSFRLVSITKHLYALHAFWKANTGKSIMWEGSEKKIVRERRIDILRGKKQKQ
jgi:hypothetical protein